MLYNKLNKRGGVNLTLGDIIKSYRLAHNLSMDSFSEKSGISKAYISLLEKNKHPKTGKSIAPSIQCIKQAAFGMNMDFNNLFNMLDGNVSLEEESSNSELDFANIGNKEIMAQNIQYYMNIYGKSRQDMCDALGVKYTTFTDWVKGNSYPRIDKIELMANYFGIEKSDLVEERRRKTKSITINVLGQVAAGIPIDAIENIIDTEEISEDMARNGNYFGLQIHGDSMEPRIYEGDVVIVRQQDDAESGDIVIAMINGNDATCKRLTKYASGIALTSLNSKYEPMMFTNQEIIEKPVRIIGKVVELRGKL